MRRNSLTFPGSSNTFAYISVSYAQGGRQSRSLGLPDKLTQTSGSTVNVLYFPLGDSTGSLYMLR